MDSSKFILCMYKLEDMFGELDPIYVDLIQSLASFLQCVCQHIEQYKSIDLS